MEGDERFDRLEKKDPFEISASSIVSGSLIGVSIQKEFESRIQSVSPSKDRRSARIIGGVEPTFIAATDSILPLEPNGSKRSLLLWDWFERSVVRSRLE